MILAAIVFGIWLVASLASGSLRTPESRRKMARDGAIVLAVIAAIVVVSSLGRANLMCLISLPLLRFGRNLSRYPMIGWTRGSSGFYGRIHATY